MDRYALVLGSGIKVSSFLPALKRKYGDTHTIIQASYVPGEVTPIEVDKVIRIKRGQEIEILSEELKKFSGGFVVNRVDLYIPLHAKIVDAFGLVGPSFEAAKKFRYKAETYRMMVEAGLSEYHPKTVVTGLDNLAETIKAFGFPAVVKPTLGAKSRGVFVIKNIEEVTAAVSRIEKHYSQVQIAKILDKPEILIEEYIDGKQIAPVSYVDQNGMLEIVAGVDVVRGPDVGQKHIQNVYRVTPSSMTQKQVLEVKGLLQKLVDVSGLKSTFLDPELYLVGDKVYLIEINVRLGGFRADLFRPAYGIDLDELVIDLAAGNKMDLVKKSTTSVTAAEVWTDDSGVIKKFNKPKLAESVNYEQYFNVGDYYLAPPQGDRPLANFYTIDESESLKKAMDIRSQFEIDIVAS